MSTKFTEFFTWPRLLKAFSGGVIGLVIYLVLNAFYNVYLHPLRKYPGPKLWAASNIPWGLSFKAGNMHNSLWDIHEKYGPIVRVGPNELSYANADAWDDVYGRYRPGKRKENQKPDWYLSKDDNDILGAATGDHGRMRKIIGGGFTNTAMFEQEPAITAYVDLLMQRLREQTDNGKATVDLWQWCVYCLFDVTGDLAFGEPFGCLKDSMMHPWISFVLSNIKLTYIMLLCNRLPIFLLYAPVMATWNLVKEYKQHRTVLRETVDRRLALEKPRPDLMQTMLEAREGMTMSREEIYSNATTLTLAGSETTASAIAGVAYMLAMRPDVQARAYAELASAFSSEKGINMRSTMQLPYLKAVINETFRIHPPGPNALWRTTPPEGNWIGGEWIPGRTIVGIPSRVVYRSEKNFKQATEFIPERWTEPGKSSEFASDRRDAFQPFSYGPRNCLGMALAEAEMRIIVARLLWNFDIEVADRSKNWMAKQKSYLMWEKPGLHVYLKPRIAISGVGKA